MSFEFKDSYTLDEFLNEYVYEHLIMYPFIMIALTIIVVIFVRIKSHSIVRSRFFKHTGYYNRFHYGGLKTVTISAVVAVCILVLVGIIFNSVLSKQIDNTIDTVFGTLTQASDKVLSVSDGLVDMRQSINSLTGDQNSGTNSQINETQTIIIEHIDIVEFKFRDMNSSLANFSATVVTPVGDLSAEAKAILISLGGYPQLVNVPDSSEVPALNTTGVDQDLDEAYDAIGDGIDELNDVRNNVRNINISDIDFTSVIDGIDSALKVVGNVSDEILGVYHEHKNNTKRDVRRYDNIRVSIIALTYLLPVIAVVLGLLVVIHRSAPVGRGWFHFLLVVACISGIFAAIYFTLSIVIRDVCHDVDQAVFTGIRSAVPDYATKNWYDELEKYYPIITKCGPNTSLIDYFDIPPEVSDLVHNSSSIVDRYTQNYTDFLTNATDRLTESRSSINAVNYTHLSNSTATIEKLQGIQTQLTNLTKFGFDGEEAYNTSLANINILTSFINATYPDQTSIIYSIFYISTNISLLQIDSPPYNYTNATYREELNNTLNVFLAVNASYTAALELTAAINANVSRLIGMVETLEQSQNDYKDLLAHINSTADSILAEFDAIEAALNDLTHNIIPSMLNITGLWDMVLEAAGCEYMAEAYDDVVHLLCTNVKGASTAYVTTQLVIVLVLLISTFAASFTNIAFQFPYKPFKYDKLQEEYDSSDSPSELRKMSSDKMRPKAVSFSVADE